MKQASFDLDGCIYMGKYPGVYPGPNDIIITGRSYQELDETIAMLCSKGIDMVPIFQDVLFKDKTRKGSGIHKGNVIKALNQFGYNIVIHFEDDPIQAREIHKIVPKVKIVLLKHNLTEKENKRHPWKKKKE